MKALQLRIFPAILIASFLLAAGGCVKKEEDQAAACKTCRAIGTTIIEKRVCSEAEEQAFRNENAGREISCR